MTKRGGGVSQAGVCCPSQSGPMADPSAPVFSIHAGHVGFFSFAFPLTAFAHVVILFRLQMIAVVYNFRL